MTAGLEVARIAFADFFEDEKVDLYTAMCLVTRDRHEAEDIAQEAFVRVLEHWDRVAMMEEPRGYLYRTAMNVFRSRSRRVAAATKRAVHRTPAHDATAEVDALDVTVRALATLSPASARPWSSPICWDSRPQKQLRCWGSERQPCACTPLAPMPP